MDAIFIKLKNVWRNLCRRFVAADMVMRLIYINVGVFLLMRLFMLLNNLFMVQSYGALYCSLPSSWSVFFTRPWTLLTYMFVHEDFSHLLINMLCLYWFGRLFLTFFNERQLCGVYLSGGFMGALFYLSVYRWLPGYSYGFLAGASASILSLLLAMAVYAPRYELRLMLLGVISLKTLSIVWIVFDLLGVTIENAGTHWAHFGGIFFGFLYAYYLKKGYDLTNWWQVLSNNFSRKVQSTKKKKRMKVTYRDVKRESDGDYNARKAYERAEIDHILDKVKRYGYADLTDDEKRKLFEAGNR